MVEPSGSVLIGYSANDFLMTEFTVPPSTCPAPSTVYKNLGTYTNGISTSITCISLKADGTIFLCDNIGNIYECDLSGNIGLWMTKKDVFTDTNAPSKSYTLPVHFTGIATNASMTVFCCTTPNSPPDKLNKGGYCYFLLDDKMLRVIPSGQNTDEWLSIAISTDNYVFVQNQSRIWYSQYQEEGYFNTLQQISGIVSPNYSIYCIPSINTSVVYYDSTNNVKIVNASTGSSNNITNSNGSIVNGKCILNDASCNLFYKGTNKVLYFIQFPSSNSITSYAAASQIQIDESSIIVYDLFDVNIIHDQMYIVVYDKTKHSINIYKSSIDYCNSINDEIATNTQLKDELLETTFTKQIGDANFADANKMYIYEFANRINLGVGIAITAFYIYYLSRVNI